MTFSPNGIHTALATPFTEDDTFDEAAFRRLIDFQLAAGASGLLVIGGSGESVSLTPPERQRRATCAVQILLGHTTPMAASGGKRSFLP
jgi:4-hydroxy-tetrahydrodipicolinate synthase